MAIRLSRSEQRRLGIAPAPSGKPRGMNKLESRFAEQLEVWKQFGYCSLLGGYLKSYAYEPIRLRLADGTFYKPDFLAHVEGTDGSMILIAFETKGFMREAARVRIKVAADKYRFIRFVIVKFEHGEWVFKEVKP